MAEHGCIVLDLRMPGLSGEGLQDRLRTMEEALPVIIITGHADTQVMARMMGKGAVAFLAKPFDDWELLDAIEAALQRNRTEVGGTRGADAQKLNRKPSKGPCVVVSKCPPCHRCVGLNIGPSSNWLSEGPSQRPSEIEQSHGHDP